MIYKPIPNRKTNFRIAFWAALFTSFLRKVTKQLFGWYVMDLGRFSIVYGSLSMLIVFVVWVYYSPLILLLGGEVPSFWRRIENRIPRAKGEDEITRRVE